MVRTALAVLLAAALAVVAWLTIGGEEKPVALRLDPAVVPDEIEPSASLSQRELVQPRQLAVAETPPVPVESEEDHLRRLASAREDLRWLEEFIVSRDAHVAGDYELAIRRSDAILTLYDELGRSLLNQVVYARYRILLQYVTFLHNDAKVRAAAAGSLRTSLSIYAQNEDRIVQLTEQRHYGEIESKWPEALIEQLRATISEADALSAQYCTPELIEAVPWQNLVSNDQSWKHSGVADLVISNGTLTGSRAADLIGAGSMHVGEAWRDFVLEGEITVEHGGVGFKVRDSKRSPNGYSFHVDTSMLSGHAAVLATTTSTFRVEMIGSTVTVSFGGSAPRTKDYGDWYMNRKGGIGMTVSCEHFTISKLRIKVLR